MLENNCCKWIEVAYLNLLDKWDNKRITVSAICERAGVTRKTFYRYFNNKPQIVERLLYEARDALFEKVNALDAPPRPDTLMLLGLEHFYRKPELAILIEHDDIRSQLRRLMQEIILEIYTRYFKQDGYHGYDAHILVAAASAVFFHWFDRGCVDQPEEIVVIFRDALHIDFY